MKVIEGLELAEYECHVLLRQYLNIPGLVDYDFWREETGLVTATWGAGVAGVIGT